MRFYVYDFNGISSRCISATGTDRFYSAYFLRESQLMCFEGNDIMQTVLVDANGRGNLRCVKGKNSWLGWRR